MWKNENDKLSKTFVFNDFKQAFSFMTHVAFWSEGYNHHPNWTNVYNRVSIELTTHDAGNIITEKDYQLAEKIDEIYLAFQKNDA